MSDRGVKQQNANTRSSMREHANTQMDHAAQTAQYGGHGHSMDAHPQTGSPHPQETGGQPAQKSKAHVAAPQLGKESDGNSGTAGEADDGDCTS